MDPILLAALNSPDWKELQRLSKKSRLSGPEVAEFNRLYRRANKDLSHLQTVAPESDAAVYLSRVVLQARVHFGSVPGSAKSTAMRFFGQSLPAALYSLRWYFVGVFVLFTGVAVGTHIWAATTPGLLDYMLPPEAQREIAERGFVAYYRENPSSIFALGVWVNNAWIAVQWVVLGITGIYVINGIIMNAANTGIMAAVMYEAGYAEDFWKFILPHGVPEITCILIAAAAGLKIFTSWIIPRNMTRRQAVAKEGRSLITVAMGLVIFLFLSGLIEGFITPSYMPFGIKMIFGAALTIGIVAYTIALGRPAYHAGLDGDLEEERAGYRTVTVQ